MRTRQRNLSNEIITTSSMIQSIKSMLLQLYLKLILFCRNVFYFCNGYAKLTFPARIFLDSLHFSTSP